MMARPSLLLVTMVAAWLLLLLCTPATVVVSALPVHLRAARDIRSRMLVSPSLTGPVRPGPNAVHLTLLHLNDCYELMPAEGTDLGGVARVAALRKQLLASNPNTYTLLAGDLFAPSALGTVQVPWPS